MEATPDVVETGNDDCLEHGQQRVHSEHGLTPKIRTSTDVDALLRSAYSS